MSNEPHSSGYQLSVKIIGLDKSKPSMAIGVMSLIAPDGEVKEFTFRSGGWGKGSLPGLSKGDYYEGDNDKIAAVYNIDDGIVRKGGAFVKGGKSGYEYEAGKGFFINIHSDEVTASTGRNGFQIHPDGGTIGTLGCVGITKDVAKEFQDIWASIPEPLRPKNLIVLKPTTELAQVVDDFEKIGKSEKQDKYLLLAYGSEGKTVEGLQTFLKNTGFYHGNLDEDFRTDTKNAVKKFQEKYGLKIDGIVGPETFGKIYEINQVAAGKNVKKDIQVNVDPALMQQFADSLNNHEYDLEKIDITALRKSAPQIKPKAYEKV